MKKYVDELKQVFCLLPFFVMAQISSQQHFIVLSFHLLPDH